MEENLVIVESPAKAKTIQKFLGKGFDVRSSFGHIRDLAKKNLGVDIKNNFQPQYEIDPEKKKTVTELKSLAKKATMVWLASDEDREGEAIAWHLSEVLEIPKEKTKRIVFHEITKEAITHAVKNPRNIDLDLVKAQQARRILDRLVGFELSPVLWKKVKPSLSAGRVQSVAVRLIVERERDVFQFKPTSSYKVTAIFSGQDKTGKIFELKAELQQTFNKKEEVINFLKDCSGSNFSISDIQTKPSTKSPAPPFTTSTLQQEASRKLGFSVSQTMTLAQKLYEAGHITYMRTDSVNLSNTALTGAKQEITNEYGAKYSKTRQFQTKSKGAQEAHEAIRPTYFSNHGISSSANEKRLYELIWKRAIASQMAEAQIEKTIVTINISERKKEVFTATGEVLKFDGFLKIYNESTDEESESNHDVMLPPLETKTPLTKKNITATEKYSHHLPRYTEASLVRKLEELGIGRPSTYAPIISTIQNRSYVIKEDRSGEERSINIIVLDNNEIKEEKKKEIFGTEKAKLFPTDIGMIVNDYLLDNFKEIMDYNFTAKVEKDFDEIAMGNTAWEKMIKGFYDNFHKKVETSIKKSETNLGERSLGTDPASGRPVLVKLGKFGPVVQIGLNSDEEKPKYASLQKGQHIETLTLDEALTLFNLPRKIGKYEDAEVIVNTGRFGPYILHSGKFYSLKKGIDDPYSVGLERAIELIEEKRSAQLKSIIKEFNEDLTLKILNGRFGPYISFEKKNYKIPKGVNPEELDYESARKIVETAPKKKGKGK